MAEIDLLKNSSFEEKMDELIEAVEKGTQPGVKSYTELENKPSINDVELNGNKSSTQLGLATAEQGDKADSAVQSVKLDGQEMKTGNTVELPAYPTELPASDVSAWAKEPNKPTYTAQEVGALPDTTEIPKVEWNQIVGVGTKIAEITIDGDTTDVFAPTGGGGGGGSTDYSELTSKPKINDVELAGNKNSTQLGLASSSQGAKADSAVQSVKLGGAEMKTGDTVELPAYPTELPASDVYHWAKTPNKPEYTKSEIGLGKVENYKAVSTEANQNLTNTEKENARANIGAGTSNFSGSWYDLEDQPTIPDPITWETVYNWGFYNKPSTGIPERDLATDVTQKLANFNSDGTIASGSPLDNVIGNVESLLASL